MIPFLPITLKSFKFYNLVYILDLSFPKGCSLSIGLEIFSFFWFRSMIIALLKHWQYRSNFKHRLIFTCKIVNESGSAVGILLNDQKSSELNEEKEKLTDLCIYKSLFLSVFCYCVFCGGVSLITWDLDALKQNPICINEPV